MVSMQLEDVSIEFPIYGGTSRSLKNAVLRASTGGRLGSSLNKRAVVKALNNVNLELKQGDRIGLVGGNGAGKTTLLRIMANVYEPTSGRVTTEGSVVPLFGGSLGMDMELPGYDNIILRGVILGLSRKQIVKKVDEIAAFTDLGDFLHLPVRTYSAGMRVRLGFAISTSVEADILLLDEGVGAGDAAFMTKARSRLLDFVDRAGLLVLATHSTSLMRSICQRALWLDRGEVRMFGTVNEVLAAYRVWILEQRELQAQSA